MRASVNSHAVGWRLRLPAGDCAILETYNAGLLSQLLAGIVGANGAGKSTLFRMLVGQEQPDSGQLKLGETVQTMYVDQSRDALQSERLVAHLIEACFKGMVAL